MICQYKVKIKEIDKLDNKLINKYRDRIKK